MTSLARAVFVVLVGATFLAFFAAQRLKGEPAVASVTLARVFSPNGDGKKEVIRLEVELRERSEVSVDIVNRSDEAVRRLGGRGAAREGRRRAQRHAHRRARLP